MTLPGELRGRGRLGGVLPPAGPSTDPPAPVRGT